MSDDLHRLLAESAIRAAMGRYIRGVDRFDMELIRSAFHEDAIDDHGNYRGPIDGFIAHLEAGLPNVERSSHFLGNQHIEVDGDRAWSETYCLAMLRMPAGEGLPRRDVFRQLRYCDRFEQRNGEWKIAHRNCAFDWTRVEPIELEHDLEGHDLGTRDKSDHAYKRLRESG